MFLNIHLFKEKTQIFVDFYECNVNTSKLTAAMQSMYIEKYMKVNWKNILFLSKYLLKRLQVCDPT